MRLHYPASNGKPITIDVSLDESSMDPMNIHYHKALARQMVQFFFRYHVICTSKVFGLLMNTKGLWDVYLQQQRLQKQLQRLHTSMGASQLETVDFHQAS